MTFRGRNLSVDWGHLIILLLIGGATSWYIMDARSVSTDTNNLLLIQPLALATLILIAVVVPQCFHYVDPLADDAGPADDGQPKEVKPSDLMQAKLPTERADVIKMLSMGGLLGLFVFSLQPLGFDIAILLFSGIGMAICGERRPLPLIVFPVIVTLITVYGFKALMPYPMITTLL
ncbi:tripartite tricarboxylate transporter TctB family protein [Mycoplana rhizolycopersici]|uniref:Tripartite tricarboxylate transporter TctB family protein n=1 Tax=Mycoplana rhizolycopersici TaxID=2746702 RepID=A0ABX2QDY8_9HYPH|nr:tripartite tricarboxylate transporter TctB family protein [Rhizobium rhizolycopersici]NVP55393.1 tripartite tricarboxylate transporter TctB family protein [Rhizobium rhizolycopersici]